MPGATQAYLSYLPDTGWEIEGSKWLASVAVSLISRKLKHPPDMRHPSFPRHLKFLPSRLPSCQAFFLGCNRLKRLSIWSRLHWLISSFSSKP